MYEGDVMFEHCYRLDIDATVGSSEKRSCWERWLSTHVRGQTRDRVEFAAGRSRALLAGPAASSVAVLGPGTVPGIEPVSTTSVACPLPETPFEAPPSTAPASPKASAAARASASAAPAPPPAVAARKGKPCLDACTSDLSQCAGKCTAARCSQRCADDVKRCMTACL